MQRILLILHQLRDMLVILELLPFLYFLQPHSGLLRSSVAHVSTLHLPFLLPLRQDVLHLPPQLAVLLDLLDGLIHLLPHDHLLDSALVVPQAAQTEGSFPTTPCSANEGVIWGQRDAFDQVGQFELALLGAIPVRRESAGLAGGHIVGGVALVVGRGAHVGETSRGGGLVRRVLSGLEKGLVHVDPLDEGLRVELTLPISDITASGDETCLDCLQH